MFYGVNNMAHLAYQDRCEIEAGLNQNMLEKDIAIKLAKDQSTIGKEIKLHLIRSEHVSLSFVIMELKNVFMLENATTIATRNVA